MTMRLLPALLLSALAGTALAKLPPPDPAAQAKADETKAKATWQAKVDGYQLCKAQDRIAAKFGGKGNGAAKAQAATAKPPASGATAAASAPAAAASGASGTPVASSAPPPCIDPGPFAYSPPEQKPLETSGAHSPASTAASPPSVRPESGAMAPAKKP